MKLFHKTVKGIYYVLAESNPQPPMALFFKNKIYYCPHKIRNSNLGSIPAKRYFSFLQSVKTGYGAHPAPTPACDMGFFHGNKAVGT